MKPFLFQVAEHLVKNCASNLSDICVIVPGKRSIVFLKKYISEIVQKPFFSPTFFSIEDFFQSLTGITPAKPEEQLLILYKIHLELLKEQKTEEIVPLHEFAGNAQLMLSDFNEIDAALVDTTVLFSSLSAIKELSFFGKEDKDLTDFQKNYLSFFKKLDTYYKHFTQALLADNKAYQGLMYRKAAENIQSYLEDKPYQKYVFVGFNALTNAEKEVVSYLKQIDKLDYLVDGDTFYVNDPIHEAGRFLRECRKEIFDNQTLSFVGNYYEELSKKIHIVGLPQQVAQAKFLHEIVHDIQSDNQDNLAIVPLDESLLIPVLHSINTEQANITMGYPVGRTLLFQWLNNLLIAMENKEKFNRKNENENTIKLYYKDLFSFFESPYVNELVGSNSIVKDLLKNQRAFYTEDDFNKLTESMDNTSIRDVLLILFYRKNTLANIADSIQNLLVEMAKTDSLNSVEQETLYLLYQQMESCKSLLEHFPISDISSFRLLLDNMISGLSLSFKSDAMGKLQILGLLESRTLDFKNIVLLSVNEDILPAGKKVNSFIPYDLKQHFGMQTYKGKDAVFSYHFFRLLQRAENIYLLYNMDAKRGDVEKSRFVHQLKRKLQAYPNVTITDEIKAYPPVSPETESLFFITKNEEILSKLAGRKYSASSINTYLECRLRFYFSYVLELKEENSLLADNMLKSNVIGTVVHHVLENAVENGRFKSLSKQEIETAVKQFMCSDKVNLTENDLLYDKNHLVYRIIIKYIEMYLQHAKNFDENIRIEQAEEHSETILPLENHSITLKGYIDRVDSCNGQKKIIDYKTGSIVEKELKIETVEDIFDGEHTKALQLMLYAYLYYRKNGTTDTEAEIVSLRKISQNYKLEINKSHTITQDIILEFEQLLKNTMEEIFNPQEAFTQTENQDHCKYCNYQNICRK